MLFILAVAEMRGRERARARERASERESEQERCVATWRRRRKARSVLFILSVAEMLEPNLRPA
jgi:hypothetical protein